MPYKIPTKKCRGCGKVWVPFVNKLAHFCLFCKEDRKKERKRYQREYNQAKVVAEIDYAWPIYQNTTH